MPVRGIGCDILRMARLDELGVRRGGLDKACDAHVIAPGTPIILYVCRPLSNRGSLQFGVS
jgi:hypothetical protein